MYCGVFWSAAEWCTGVLVLGCGECCGLCAVHCRNLVSLTIFFIFFNGNNSRHYESSQKKDEPCGIKIGRFFLL